MNLAGLLLERKRKMSSDSNGDFGGAPEAPSASGMGILPGAADRDGIQEVSRVRRAVGAAH